MSVNIVGCIGVRGEFEGVFFVVFVFSDMGSKVSSWE